MLDPAGAATAFLALPKDVVLPASVTLHHVAVIFDDHGQGSSSVMTTDVTVTALEP